MPPSSGRPSASQPGSSSMSRIFPKSSRRCSGREAKASAAVDAHDGDAAGVAGVDEPRADEARGSRDEKRVGSHAPDPTGSRLATSPLLPMLRTMTITSFVKHHFRHFNAATVVDAAEAWNGLLAGGGKMFLTMAGAMSTAEIGLSLAEMIRQGQGPRDHVHGREPRGGRLQPRRARPLRADPALPPAEPGRGGGAPRQAPQPRDGHVHPRGGGDPPHREGRPRGMAGRRPRRRAPVPARVPLPHPPLGEAEGALPDRPEGLLAPRGRREEPPDRSSPAGRTRRSATSSRRTASRATSRTSTR